MKKLILSLLLCAPILAQAVTYYISDCAPGAVAHCVAGNNANDGLSPATPKRSHEVIPTSTLSAGDSILWAKGSKVVQKVFYRIVPLSGTRASPVTFGAYVPPWAIGGEGRPILAGDSTYSGTINTFWRIQNTGYIVVRGLEFAGVLNYPCPTASAPTKTCLFVGAIFQGGGGMLMEDIETHGWTFAIQGNPANRFVTLRNSIIRNNGQGIQGVLTDMLIENNTFRNHGDEGVRDHHLYPSAAKRLIIRNNYFKGGNKLGDTFPCGGVAVVFHGETEDILFENNAIIEDTAKSSCFGIEFSAAYGSGRLEYMKRIVVRGNTIVNPGAVGISLAICNSCLVENNTIIMRIAGKAIFSPSNNVATRFTGKEIGIPQVTIRNNSIYFESTVSGGWGIHYLVNADNGFGVGHIIANNMTYYANPAGLTKTCYNVGAPTAGQFAAINGNSCYAAGGTLQWSAQYPTLALAQAAPGGPFGVNDLFGVNPLLAATPTEANGWSLAVSTGSPLINAGLAPYTAKLAIKGFLPNGLRDIGAHEFGATLKAPPPPSGFRLR